MTTLILHIVPEKRGWSIKQNLEEPASVLLENKAEALSVARRMAASKDASLILLHSRGGANPKPIARVPRKLRWRQAGA